MADDKIQLPSGMGGLIRYSDQSGSKFQLKPGTIVVFIVLLVIIEILLHAYGGNLI